MKKIIVLFLLLFLSSCFGNKKEEDKTLNFAGLGTGVVNLSGKVNTGNINTGNIEEESYNIIEKKKRFQIKKEDIMNIYLGKYDSKDEKINGNPVLENGYKFINSLKKVYSNKVTKKVDGGIEYKDFEGALEKTDKKYLKDFNLYLKIFDKETKKEIKNGFVYLNNIKFGEFKDGIFKKDYKWPIGIENFFIMIKADGYGDGFLNINSLYNDGSLSYGEIFMKKSKNFEVTLNKDLKIGDLKEDNFLLEVPTCSLVDNDGRCFKGKVNLKTNYISSYEVNTRNTSLNMNSVTNEGDLYSLYSGGMLFTEFITDNGEILNVGNGKKIRITYKLTDEDIEAFGDLGTKEGDISKKGYWLYDKDNFIWREGYSYSSSIDKENKLFIFDVKKVY